MPFGPVRPFGAIPPVQARGDTLLKAGDKEIIPSGDTVLKAEDVLVILKER